MTQVQNVGDQVPRHAGGEPGHQDPRPARSPRSSQPQLLGSPDVDLNPGYTGGPYLASGATIPEGHTAVPVSTDEVLKELQQTLNAINPHAVGDLVSNLASDLNGQGSNLNKLISRLPGRSSCWPTRATTSGSSTGPWPS